MYKIDIEKIAFEAIIGILPQERQASQPLVVDASFWYEYDKDSFLDYAAITDTIISHIQKKRFFLLEDALHSTITLLKKEFPTIQKATLRITKPQILPNAIPSVELTLKFKNS